MRMYCMEIVDLRSRRAEATNYKLNYCRFIRGREYEREKGSMCVFMCVCVCVSERKEAIDLYTA
jgi:hypothetical protein